MMPVSPVRPFLPRTLATFAPRSLTPRPATRPTFSGLNVDSVRFGNSQHSDSANEALMAKLITLATPYMEKHYDGNFTIDLATINGQKLDNIVQNPINSVLRQVDETSEDRSTFKDTLNAKEKDQFKTALKKSLFLILSNFKQKEEVRAGQVRQHLEVKAKAYYAQNPQSKLGQDYEILKQQLIRDKQFPLEISQKAQNRLDNALRTALQSIKNRHLDSMQAVPAQDMTKVDAPLLKHILAVANPLLERYIDSNFEPCKDEDKAIANACSTVWRLPLNHEASHSPKLGNYFSAQQKDFVKAQLKAQLQPIYEKLAAEESSLHQRANNALQQFVPPYFDNLNVKMKFDALFTQVRSDVVKSLAEEQGIHVHELTDAARERFNWSLKQALLRLAHKRDPQEIPARLLREHSTSKLMVRTAEAIEASPKPKLKDKKVKGQGDAAVENDMNAETALTKTSMTKITLPPAYSTLQLPDSDLKLLQRAKPDKQPDLERWKELRGNLHHDLISFLAAHTEVQAVLLEAGKKPRYQVKDNAAWQELAESKETKIEDIQAIHPSKLEGRQELRNMLNLMPEWIQHAVQDLPQITQDEIKEIDIDFGRKAYCSTENTPFNWLGTRTVDQDDIDTIMNNVKAQGGEFNVQHRYTPDGALSRISLSKHLDGQANGFSFAIGRPLVGCYGPLQDLIDHSEDHILLVGPPGSGKTSLLRHILSSISERAKVQLVDVSGEVAGSGRIPKHVGNTRVTHIPLHTVKNERDLAEATKQAIINAIQNNRPHVVSRDEIPKDTEAFTLLSGATRGVRIVATAHAKSFDDLVHNVDLKLLTGGRDSAAVSDTKAKQDHTGKFQSSRLAPCLFNTIIVLSKNGQGEHEASVIREPNQLIDRILGKSTKIEG